MQNMIFGEKPKFDTVLQTIEMLEREPVDGIDATIKLNENATSFDEMTADDIKILDKEAIQKIKTKNPQLKFQLGI